MAALLSPTHTTAAPLGLGGQRDINNFNSVYARIEILKLASRNKAKCLRTGFGDQTDLDEIIQR